MKLDPQKYFDHNATTPLAPASQAAMRSSIASAIGNPSSVHDFGAAASYQIESARHAIADLIGAKPEQLFFTSGGTEADNLALYSALMNGEGRVALSPIEHPAARDPVNYWAEQQGREITRLKCDEAGIVDLAGVEDASLAVLMLANNESGVIQDVSGARAATDGWLHCDAVQAVGKIPVNLAELGVDSAALSAHKFYGPKGIGLLYLKNPEGFTPLQRGGSQEGYVRPGTMNCAGIVGMAAALTAAYENMQEVADRQRSLRALLLERLSRLDVSFEMNGGIDRALPNTLNIWLPGHAAGDTVRTLADQGLAVSAGAACASGAKEPQPSPVLMAMGFGETRSKESIRISMGHANSEASVLKLAEAIAKL